MLIRESNAGNVSETASEYFFVSWTQESVVDGNQNCEFHLRFEAEIETRNGFLVFRARFCFWVNNRSVDVWRFLQTNVWVECFVYNSGSRLALYGHRVLQIFSISSARGCCASSSILLIARRLVNFIRPTMKSSSSFSQFPIMHFFSFVLADDSKLESSIIKCKLNAAQKAAWSALISALDHHFVLLSWMT